MTLGGFEFKVIQTQKVECQSKSFEMFLESVGEYADVVEIHK